MIFMFSIVVPTTVTVQKMPPAFLTDSRTPFKIRDPNDCIVKTATGNCSHSDYPIYSLPFFKTFFNNNAKIFLRDLYFSCRTALFLPEKRQKVGSPRLFSPTFRFVSENGCRITRRRHRRKKRLIRDILAERHGGTLLFEHYLRTQHTVYTLERFLHMLHAVLAHHALYF